VGGRAGAARGRTLRVLAVHEWIAFPHVPTGVFSGESANQALRRGLRGQLDEAMAAVRREVPTEGVLAEGGAVQVLERAAAELDLLVLGSRGYGPLRAVLLGSVSEQLLRTALAPLVVIPRGTPAGEPLERSSS
jgi:nucleotide-binding universal stress UspA family protein